MTNYEIYDFIGVFENAVSDEDCDRIIEHFELLQQQKLTYDRMQEDSKNVLIEKDGDVHTIGGTSNMLQDTLFCEEIVTKRDIWIFKKFRESIMECYQHYCKQYGVLMTIAKHAISGAVKIQKTKPSQGYHVWHCEHAAVGVGERIMLIILYLNDVNEGGETEFLYQRKRIKPKKGTLLICPAGYTHTHRGNPPFDADKYILTTWLEFIE
jgi:hypothetical protein